MLISVLRQARAVVGNLYRHTSYKTVTVKTALLTFIFIIAFISCSDLYEAGNRVDLSYPIQTPLRTEIIERYIDTLIQTKGFAVPNKWKHLDKLVDLDSINNKRIYFPSNPEEMYLISYPGMLILSDVYNPKIMPDDWIAVPERMPKSEEIRIKKRFQEVLKEVEKLAHKDNLPDSIIYK